MAKKVKISNNTVAAVLYVLVGVLFCIFKASMLNWLLTAAGIVFIVLGVLDILKKNLVNGIVEAVIGVVILVGGWAFVEVALIIFGALLVIKGVIDLMAAIKAKAGIFTMIAAGNYRCSRRAFNRFQVGYARLVLHRYGRYPYR